MPATTLWQLGPPGSGRSATRPRGPGLSPPFAVALFKHGPQVTPRLDVVLFRLRLTHPSMARPCGRGWQQQPDVLIVGGCGADGREVARRRFSLLRRSSAVGARVVLHVGVRDGAARPLDRGGRVGLVAGHASLGVVGVVADSGVGGPPHDCVV